MFKLIAFIAVSAVIVYISWPSFRDRHSHGFYRFFVFESILILFLLNVKSWFHYPFSVLQIASWLLLSASLILAGNGFYCLRMMGKPRGNIENTTVLVTQGVYRYIRHPLYGSLLLFAWGVFLKDPSLPGAVLASAASAFSAATARVEEDENLRKFGSVYAEYTKKTKMFIPFVF